MSANQAGWALIGFSFLVGILRIMKVIDVNVTVVLVMGAVVVFGGVAIKAIKKKEETESDS